MAAIHKSRWLRWMVTFLFIIGISLVFVGSGVTAQAAPTISQLQDQLQLLQDRLDTLEKAIIVIPAVAALLVVVIQIINTVQDGLGSRRAQKSELRYLAMARSQQRTETASATQVNAVMESVAKLLKFEADRAEILKKEADELAAKRKRFDPENGVNVILDKVNTLRKAVHRSNLHDYSTPIMNLDHAIQNMEEQFDFKDFQDSIGCHYIRGLAAHLTSDIEAEEDHFKQVIAKKSSENGADPYIEPMSLYFLGLLYKNLANFAEAKSSFQNALAIWPKGKVEIRSWVELAEAVGLQSHYSADETQKAFASIAEEDDDIQHGRRGQRTTKQEQDKKVLQERLYLIAGNGAFVHRDYDQALVFYDQARTANPSSPFADLSIGIALLKKNGHLQAQEPEEKTCFEDSFDKITAQARFVTHPELRGRILLGGAAIITARLGGLRDPIEIEVNVFKEIQALLTINAQSTHNFHIFSPLTKAMVTLDDFILQIHNPSKLL